MLSIKNEFINLLKVNHYTVVSFLDYINHGYGVHISRAYFYELLNHPDKIKLGYIQIFSSILGLDKQQVQRLFFQNKEVDIHE